MLQSKRSTSAEHQDRGSSRGSRGEPIGECRSGGQRGVGLLKGSYSSSQELASPSPFQRFPVSPQILRGRWKGRKPTHRVSRGAASTPEKTSPQFSELPLPFPNQARSRKRQQERSQPVPALHPPRLCWCTPRSPCTGCCT